MVGVRETGKITPVATQNMEKMLRLLCKQPLGQIVACNIIDGINSGVVDQAMAKNFLFACLNKYRVKTHKNTQSLVLMFEEIALGDASGNGFLLRGKYRHTISGKDSSFSNITSRRVFVQRLLDKTDWSQKSFGRRAPSLASRSHSAFGLSEKVTEHKLLSDCHIGRAENRCFWITVSSHLEEMFNKEKSDDHAQKVRDGLGLIHMNEAPMVEIRMDAAKLNKLLDMPGRKMARPTFADAGAHRRFKTRTDTPKNKGVKNWGFTADLEKLDAGTSTSSGLLDGFREQVVSSLPGSEVKIIHVRTLHGELSNRAPDKDDTFAKCLMNGRDENDLFAALLECVK